jgi:hypothetical protein
MEMEPNGSLESPAEAPPLDRLGRVRRPAHTFLSRCTVCCHKDKIRIELLRAGGASVAALSREFGVSTWSIYHHFKAHISSARLAEMVAGPLQVEQLVAAAADESRHVIEYFGIVRSVLFNQFLTCARTSDHVGVVNVGGRLIEALRELGRMTGELRALSGLTIKSRLA